MDKKISEESVGYIRDTSFGIDTEELELLKSIIAEEVSMTTNYNLYASIAPVWPMYSTSVFMNLDVFNDILRHMHMLSLIKIVTVKNIINNCEHSCIIVMKKDGKLEIINEQITPETLRNA
jgi:hypothetical protein